MEPWVYRIDDRETWCTRVAARVSEVVGGAVTARGRASIVVPGGSTPKPVFESLNRHGLPWRELYITLSDERWVPPDDAASNQRLVTETLLRGVPSDRHRLTGLWQPGTTVEDAVPAVGTIIQSMPRPFDLVMLGMGGDGHTASLFPGQPATREGLGDAAWCVANRAPDPPHERMSLGLRALLDADLVVLPLTGEDKWAVLNEALHPGSAEELPVRAVLHQQRVPVEVYWSP